jgi:hypothetical protein
MYKFRESMKYQFVKKECYGWQHSLEVNIIYPTVKYRDRITQMRKEKEISRRKYQIIINKSNSSSETEVMYRMFRNYDPRSSRS